MKRQVNTICQEIRIHQLVGQNHKRVVEIVIKCTYIILIVLKNSTMYLAYARFVSTCNIYFQSRDAHLPRMQHFISFH